MYSPGDMLVGKIKFLFEFSPPKTPELFPPILEAVRKEYEINPTPDLGQILGLLEAATALGNDAGTLIKNLPNLIEEVPFYEEPRKRKDSYTYKEYKEAFFGSKPEEPSELPSLFVGNIFARSINIRFDVNPVKDPAEFPELLQETQTAYDAKPTPALGQMLGLFKAVVSMGEKAGPLIEKLPDLVRKIVIEPKERKRVER